VSDQIKLDFKEAIRVFEKELLDCKTSLEGNVGLEFQVGVRAAEIFREMVATHIAANTMKAMLGSALQVPIGPGPLPGPGFKPGGPMK
jgi:hypothetical protein